MASIGSSGEGGGGEHKRLGDAGKQDARGGVCGDSAAFLLAQARLGGSKSGRVKLRGRAARQGGGSPGASARARSADDITTAIPKRRSCGSMVAGFGLDFRGGGRATTRPRAAAIISRRAADLGRP